MLDIIKNEFDMVIFESPRSTVVNSLKIFHNFQNVINFNTSELLSIYHKENSLFLQ